MEFRIVALSNYCFQSVLKNLQEGCPLKIIAFHIVNQPMTYNLAFALASPFISKKVRQIVSYQSPSMYPSTRHENGRRTTFEFTAILLKKRPFILESSENKSSRLTNRRLTRVHRPSHTTEGYAWGKGVGFRMVLRITLRPARRLRCSEQTCFEGGRCDDS